MKFKMHWLIVGISFTTGVFLNCALVLNVSAQQSERVLNKHEFCRNQLQGENFTRTELFFGLSKPDGYTVTEEEFQTFVDSVVTPLFPEGLTLLTGTGQFKNSSGAVIQEGSKLLILLYPFNWESNRRIKQVQELYIKTFQQQSVLRTDEQSCVSF